MGGTLIMALTVTIPVTRDSYNFPCDNVKIHVTITQDNVTFTIDNDRELIVEKSDMLLLSRLLNAAVLMWNFRTEEE
jgi:hypothetical protein